ncbi:MAG: dienelactone hydrolase family protein [Deltaproteobacteria bacterium]|nr:dienelactone hydrolase family protein [Deltaproteobacteria bacterium]
MMQPATAQEVTFPAPAEFPCDHLRGYLAAPAGSEPRPGVVLVPDVRGLYDHFRDVARRLAAEGFVTLAVDLYSREDAPELGDLDAVMRWMGSLPDRRILGDLGAAARWLGDHPRVAGRQVGITGFCMGGQYALMAACSDDRLGACVSWYGLLRYARKSAARPADPLDMAPQLGCATLALFGADDSLIPPADVQALREALTAAGKQFEIEVYEGAGHAFFNDARPEMYRADAAAAAWPRAVEFLRRHLA